MAASSDPVAESTSKPEPPSKTEEPSPKTAPEASPDSTKDIPPIEQSKSASGEATPLTALSEAGKKPNDGIDEVNPHDFKGEVLTNNELPTTQTLKKIEDYVVLDRHGKTHTFKSLYTGRNVARRVLLIFVRHFFCGNCQEYLRALSASITPDALLRLPISTFIAIIGCGDPGLIDMYVQETNCPFPVYADPTRKLYLELGMIRTLALGSKPAYMKKNIFTSSMASVFQGLKQLKSGLVTKAGDARQIGGEFLFEPLSVMTPTDEVDRQMGKSSASIASASMAKANGGGGNDAADSRGASGQAEDEDEGVLEEKRVTWCHRMKTTRDHAEIPELMEILALDGQGQPIKDKKRWSKALEVRKGTGLSMASQMSSLKNQAAGT